MTIIRQLLGFPMLSLALMPYGAMAQAPASARAQTPILVELFTSEGCSSCPPADALLAKLEREQPVRAADIVVLEEHVDYWESLGWHDRFSARLFTDRQNAYGRRMNLSSVYTPQMVVDGTDEFVGNDTSQALKAIAHAASMPKLPLTVSQLMLDGGKASGTITLVSAKALPKGDLYAAVVQPMASTKVLRGENGGRTLQHVSVVRSLQRVGSLDALAHGTVPFTVDLPADGQGMRVVVFAQRTGQGGVVGVASAGVPDHAAQQQAMR